MNLGHLTSFHAVATTGSLTTAAHTLFITQPAVSHHIKALEEYLGVRLFVRHKKGMLLTVEGEELRAACRDVVRAAEGVSFQVQQINRLKRGKITISITSFLSSALTPAFLAFKKEYPGVQLCLHFNNTDGVIRCMKDNQADLGFSSSVATTPPSVAAGTVHSEQLLLLARSDHPLCGRRGVTPEDLGEHLFVTREIGTFTRQHTEQWFGHTPLPANTIESSRADSVRALILAGAVGIMPGSSVRDEIAEGKMCVLPAEGLQSWVDCSVYVSTARPLSKAARAFLQMAGQERCFSRSEELERWMAALA